jgi:hypothetical protein
MEIIITRLEVRANGVTYALSQELREGETKSDEFTWGPLTDDHYPTANFDPVWRMVRLDETYQEKLTRLCQDIRRHLDHRMAYDHSTIQLIRIVRDNLGLGLREARDLVDPWYGRRPID